MVQNKASVFICFWHNLCAVQNNLNTKSLFVHHSEPLLTFDVHHRHHSRGRKCLDPTKDKLETFSYPNHLFWTDSVNWSEVLHKTSAKQKQAREHKNVGLGAFICTLTCKLYLRCSIFLLIGMANQLIQGSCSGNPPSGWRKGGKEETRKERDWGRKGGAGQVKGPGFFGGDLHGEQDEESHHQTEETHGLGQSEPQDGVGEQLLLQGRVSAEESNAVQSGRAISSGQSQVWPSKNGYMQHNLGVFIKTQWNIFMFSSRKHIQLCPFSFIKTMF